MVAPSIFLVHRKQMNHPSVVLVAGLALANVQLFAREPQAPPSPAVEAASRPGSTGRSAKGNSLFVGHYGETIEFPSSWTAEAEMRGETEAVFFHSKFEDDFQNKPLRPKKSDYRPENFTPMGLMELVVLPKDAPGGLGSLAAIRAAKELELKEQGVDYGIFEETGEKDWPRATFHVNTKNPYRLWQTYSQSPSAIYILTTGDKIEAGEFGLDQARIENIHSASQLVNQSLSESLKAMEGRTAAGRLFHFQDEAARDIFSGFKNFFRYEYYRSAPAARLLAAATVVMLILALWPGRTAGSRRARLFGRSMLFFALLAGFSGFLTVYLPAKFAGALWNSDDLAFVVPVLPLAVVGWAAARRLRSSRAGRVSMAMAALAAAWAFIFLWRADMENLDLTSVLAFEITFFHLFIGLTFGVAFAAAFGPLPDKEASR